MTEQELLNEILEYAESNDPVTFKLIQTEKEYFSLRSYRRTVKLIINSLRSGNKKLLKGYCKEVEQGTASIQKLLAYRKIVNIINVYNRDLVTINDMLDEYETYLISGNLADLLLGETRPDDKLYDHRGY